MASKPRFDMRDRHGRGERGECAPKRARCVALDDEEIGRLAKARPNRLRHAPHMRMRILRARALEPNDRKGGKPVLGRIEIGMLPGQDQHRAHAECRESSGNRG
jgi:hypothetical protein